MKICLITDTHWGIKNDHPAFIDSSKDFLCNIFWPYLREHSISTVVHLGDLVDRRKYINYITANRLRVDFLNPIKEMQLYFHIIAGNHDTYYKNTNEFNCLRELVVGGYPDFKVYDNYATEVLFDNLKVLFIPWICDDNRKQTLEIIKGTDAKYVMGHLEIQGFEMYKGSPVSHGDDRSLFGNFDNVFSGHFHHRSTDGTIFYLGSHMEFTWSDYDDPKGFHIFDTETKKIEFIKNPYVMFKKIWYDDTKENFSFNDIPYSDYKNSIIKVVVTEKTNHLWFDKFIENLESQNPVEMQIVDDHLNLALEDDDDIINEAESTLGIFKNYINGMGTKLDKTKIENKIVEIYNEALVVEG